MSPKSGKFEIAQTAPIEYSRSCGDFFLKNFPPKFHLDPLFVRPPETHQLRNVHFCNGQVGKKVVQGGTLAESFF
jgi:hypothetical protein